MVTMATITHVMIAQNGRYVLVGKRVYLDDSVLSTNEDIYTVLQLISIQRSDF